MWPSAAGYPVHGLPRRLPVGRGFHPQPEESSKAGSHRVGLAAAKRASRWELLIAGDSQRVVTAI